jgi:argininosuccinate lyase
MSRTQLELAEYNIWQSESHILQLRDEGIITEDQASHVLSSLRQLKEICKLKYETETVQPE